jgi:hypothetical protein
LILRRFAGVALILVAVAARPVQASDAVGVEILQYGLFRSDIVGKQVDSGGSAMHNVVDNICHLATTRTVPMKIGMHFGVRYKVTGPVARERVLLRKVIRYPAVMAPPSPARPSSLVSSFVELRVGTTTYTEYALEQPWELAPGPWTFQFFEGDRKLAEFGFTVSGDAFVPESAEPTCFQLSS